MRVPTLCPMTSYDPSGRRRVWLTLNGIGGAGANTRGALARNPTLPHGSKMSE